MAVPPFIPGLLVVCLLITISMLIWWRNYIRRTNPGNIPGIDDWEYWEREGMDERAFAKLEKPKLWEVGVGLQDVDERTFHETGWEKMAVSSQLLYLMLELWLRSTAGAATLRYLAYP